MPKHSLTVHQTVFGERERERERERETECDIGVLILVKRIRFLNNKKQFPGNKV